ncbi:hypothetical protein BI364_03800 [Acidihalobacter yilgarnensis]|uniref:Lipoprotein n=1 Tax=Acidihalobacter yilgarnensis TaxID=2819280 RepID=A0A1D8IL79_9GAMM|nr:hypothetical protein [Acidihalobacter yilgarnensis]AOU97236.1 hypothetical protein BI364_03800 [Acidihalobacter yilgarnensis]
MSRLSLPLFALALPLLLSACAGAPLHQNQANECSDGLRTAYSELEQARAHGFDGSVEWTKAAGLLTAAKVQQQFGKYPNCINKVRRARYYIHQAQMPH